MRTGNLGRLLELGLRYRGKLAVAVALAVAAAAAGLVMPLGLRALLDGVLREADNRLLNRLALGLLVLFAARAGLGFAGRYLLRRTGERITADLRVRLYAHLQTLGVRYFAGQRTGDLLSRLDTDVASVRQAITETVAQCVMHSMTLMGSVVVMLALNPYLGALILAAVPLTILAARAFDGPLRRLSHRTQQALGTATATAEQALSAIGAVKAFGRENHETARYRTAVEEVFTASRKHALASVLLSSCVDLLFSSLIVALFWYGGMEVLAGRLTPGEIVAFLFYALAIAQGMAALVQAYAVFAAAAGSSRRIFEVLDQVPDVSDSPRAVALPRGAGSVRFERVDFDYTRGQPVLREVSLTVHPGETVALVGPSGAGKSTLLHLIPRFFDPVRGGILIDGHDVRTVRLASLRERIALVTQEVHLFAGSVRENIRYGRLEATNEEIVAAAHAANADGFIRILPEGYDSDIGERGVKLSGGQRQRLAIARALLKNAPILLLDEATSALDAESEALVQAALETLMQGRTTFIIAHRLATVREADRIFVLENGIISETGTHEELVALGGLYNRLAAYQFQDSSSEARAA